MDKLQKEIKKRMNKDKQDFNDWYAENHKLLGKFGDDKSSEIDQGGIAAKRKLWLPVAVFLLVAVICLAIVLPLSLNHDNDFDIGLGGGEDSYESIIPEDELNELLIKYDFLNKMMIDEQLEVRLLEDDKLVMYIIGGNISERQEYYITVRIPTDSGYNFATKEMYKSLPNETNAGEWFVAYGAGITHGNGLYIYLLRMEKGEEILYMQVQCPEDGISYILNEFII